MSDPLAEFAAVYVTLYTTHMIVDHWIQTDHQACTKIKPGWAGRLANTTHVLTHVVLALAGLMVLVWQLGAVFAPADVAIGLAVTGVTHWIADRRWPIQWLAARTGRGRFAALGVPRPGHDDNPSIGTGAYVLDQTWHLAWLFVSALIIV
ncbi:DUF3307 domain-containing protein [Herbidospora sp. NBRC 101105]|uniref:DUF3307 domain-containing protein n=1 Tax=Herbidospora sp. NBRC 101105 TaxID=3032195 RepID=UPI0024A1BC68|nr:DUF3307 domain-containing protein [Herbidospora sp. NBRC 101105]GLX96375.1 hypothetical protein Hesp01_43250 [Herbidospora sp. NBRC 101105]